MQRMWCVRSNWQTCIRTLHRPWPRQREGRGQPEGTLGQGNVGRWAGEQGSRLGVPSRWETGAKPLQTAPLHPGRLLKELTILCRPATKRKGLEFRVEPSTDAHGVIGDESRLRLVVASLLANSIKHTATGWVRLAAYPSAPWARPLEVRHRPCGRLVNSRSTSGKPHGIHRPNQWHAPLDGDPWLPVASKPNTDQAEPEAKANILNTPASLPFQVAAVWAGLLAAAAQVLAVELPTQKRSGVCI